MHSQFEHELVAALNAHDELVRRCAAGHMSFADFCVKYDNFYWSHALDGHEASAAEASTLATLDGRIAPHRHIAESILAMVCSDSDAFLESYRQSGRFGSAEALARLQNIALGLSSGEP